MDEKERLRRERISATKKRQFAENPELAEELSRRRQREFLDSLADDRRKGITHKTCCRCGERKLIREFRPQKRKLKSGLISVAPSPYCLGCERLRNKEYDERHKEKRRKAARKRLAEETSGQKQARRRRQREWATTRRRQGGVRSNGTTKTEDHGHHLLPVAPIAGFLAERTGLLREITDRSGIHQRTLWGIRNEEFPSARMDIIDKILIALGEEHRFCELYPVEDEESREGRYEILDPDGLLEKTDDAL